MTKDKTISNKKVISDITLFQKKLLEWYKKHGRKNLPWQGKSPYLVWVSEVMLQQTQVIKVIEYFQKFITRFSTLQELADADIQQVLQLWSGLGYYNRARNLHKAAIICSNEYAGLLPIELKQLMALPGIGRTTAGAILSLASNLQYPILDGNVKRVVSRVFAVAADKESELNNALWSYVTQLVPKHYPKDHNQALMDLGSMICTRTKPLCTECPFMKMCKAYKLKQIAMFPQIKSKTKQVKVTLYALLIIIKGEVYLQQRNIQGIWPGLWFLPVFNSLQELKQCKEFSKFNHFDMNSFSVTHILTHRVLNIKASVFNSDNLEQAKIDKMKLVKGKWVNLSEIKNISHPAALIKVLKQYQQLI